MSAGNLVRTGKMHAFLLLLTDKQIDANGDTCVICTDAAGPKDARTTRFQFPDQLALRAVPSNDRVEARCACHLCAGLCALLRLETAHTQAWLVSSPRGEALIHAKVSSP